MPDVEYTALLAKELDYLMRGWVKCKEYIGSNLKPTSSGTSSTSSTPDESKVITDNTDIIVLSGIHRSNNYLEL